MVQKFIRPNESSRSSNDPYETRGNQDSSPLPGNKSEELDDNEAKMAQARAALDDDNDSSAGDDDDGLDLGNAEGAGASQGASTAEKKEKAKAGVTEPENDGGGGWETNVSKKGRPNIKQRVGAAGKSRKFFIGGFIGAGLIAVVISLFAFLLPFKLTHIMESIEQRVGGVPQYAVEKRVEFYMSRYLMIRSLEATGKYDFGPGGKDRDKFTYLGSGFWDTMYTNWRGAKLEEQLVSKYNVKLNAVNNDAEIFRTGKLKATDFQMEDLGAGSNSPRRTQPFDRREARELIKDFAKNETKSHQVLKRFNMRRVMKKYYGVGNWKPFERKTDEVSKKYQDKKRAFKQRLVTETVGRVSDRYDEYMRCLLSTTSSKECRDVLKKADYDPNAPDRKRTDDGITEAQKTIDADTSNDSSSSKQSLSKEISGQVREFGLKRALQTLAAGIGIVETLTQIYSTVDNGVVNQIIYDKNAQQYLAYGSSFFSAADQIVANEDFDVEDVRVAHEILGEYTESPVYQSDARRGGTVSAAEQVWRDCNNDETDGKETLLEEGETVCQEKRLNQDKTAFTNSAGWQALGKVVTPYKNTLGKIVSRITGVISDVMGALGINDLIEKVASFLKIDVLTAKAFGGLMNLFSGPVIAGAEVDEDAYDNLYAAIAVRQSAVGGEVGVAKEDTIGGAYLSDVQAAVIRDQQMEDYYHELQNKSFFARYFSPRVKESLTGQLAMNAPTSFSDFSTNAVATLSSPMNLLGSLFDGFTPKLGAQALPKDNPFKVLHMGFAADHPVFTANNGEGMNPDEVKARYYCDLPVNQRPQNTSEFEGQSAFGRPEGVYFDVPLIADPCLLEDAAVDTGTRYFSGKTTDADLVEGGSATNSGVSSIVPGSLLCPEVMEAHPTQTGYFKMPQAPNGEYYIYSRDARRYGSKQLVCTLYTVALAYNSMDAYKGKSRVQIGDLNAGEPHVSHYRGIAVDLDAGGVIAAADHINSLGKYSTQATIDLGKLFVDTGVIRNLWWCDPGDGSLAAIVAYAQSKNTPLVGAKCIEGHKNHFHIDISLDYILPGDFRP